MRLFGFEIFWWGLDELMALFGSVLTGFLSLPEVLSGFKLLASTFFVILSVFGTFLEGFFNSSPAKLPLILLFLALARFIGFCLPPDFFSSIPHLKFVKIKFQIPDSFIISSISFCKSSTSVLRKSFFLGLSAGVGLVFSLTSDDFEDARLESNP